jgi:hypothetical protein
VFSSQRRFSSFEIADRFCGKAFGFFVERYQRFFRIPTNSCVDVNRRYLKVWINDPRLHVPPRQGTRGRAPTKCQTAKASVEVQAYVKSLGAQAWTRATLRDSTRGPLQVEIITRRVHLWDGKENKARCWDSIVQGEINSPETIKYSLCNAPADTPLLRLAQMQGLRYWVERVFQDAKGECGLADYQVLSWLAWHHHVTMVMLAMLFIAEQRQTGNPELELLTPRDIVEILIETLPRKPEGKQALVDRINLRHRRRQSAIDSRFRCKENDVKQLRIVDSSCDSGKLGLARE